MLFVLGLDLYKGLSMLFMFYLLLTSALRARAFRASPLEHVVGSLNECSQDSWSQICCAHALQESPGTKQRETFRSPRLGSTGWPDLLGVETGLECGRSFLEGNTADQPKAEFDFQFGVLAGAFTSRNSLPDNSHFFQKHAT